MAHRDERTGQTVSSALEQLTEAVTKLLAVP
jgi:hypothetical protein